MAPFLCLGDLPLVGRLPRFQLALFCIFCNCIFCIFVVFYFSPSLSFLLSHCPVSLHRGQKILIRRDFRLNTIMVMIVIIGLHRSCDTFANVFFCTDAFQLPNLDFQCFLAIVFLPIATCKIFLNPLQWADFEIQDSKCAHADLFNY